MFDLTKFIPYLLAAAAIAIAVGWFVAHDRAVAAKAVAVDRAAANEVVIATQQAALDKQKQVNDYAEKLAEIRLAERNAEKQRADRYAAAFVEASKDPDVARVLNTRLPQSLRELRRAGATPGGGDRVSVFRPPRVAGPDAGTGPAGRDGGPGTRGEPATPRSVDLVQRGQGQNPPAGEPPKATGLRWINPLNWFQPAPGSAP